MFRECADVRIPIIVVAAVAAAAAIAAQEPRVRLNVHVAAATPFSGSDGLIHVAYELNVTVIGPGDARVDRVQVFAEPATSLISYSAAELDDRMLRPDAEPDARRTRLVRSGTTSIIHVLLTFPDRGAVPASLRHVLTAVTDDGSSVPIAAVHVDLGPITTLVLGPPLGGGLWFAHNGPSNHRSAHWGSALIDRGRARIPQRFAIDFIGIDANGRAVRRDFRKSANEDWVGFGADVIAASDAVVYAMRDGVDDNAALAEPGAPVSPSIEATYGNYVILSLGDGRFVHYAHLRRNSVTVKTGQPISRGQLLGRVGNSGNTNAPHLHFNVTDVPSPEAAEGLAYVFDAFDWFGRTTADQAVAGETGPWASTATPVARTRALPLDGSVVRFRAPQF